MATPDNTGYQKSQCEVWVTSFRIVGEQKPVNTPSIAGYYHDSLLPSRAHQ